MSMSSPKKDPDRQQGTGAARGRPPVAMGAAVPGNHEGKTPRPPQKVEKSSRRGSGEGGGRGPGRGGGAEGGQQGKKKPTTKEERRAIQEAQRRAKAERAAGAGKPPHKPGGESSYPSKEQKTLGGKPQGSKPGPQVMVGSEDPQQQQQQKTLAKMTKSKSLEKPDQKKVQLFSHLDQYEREACLTKSLDFSAGGIHPAIIKLGLQYSEGIISGSNARCIALLAAFKKVIQDYNIPPEKELRRDLDTAIKPYITFLSHCRPLSVSMGSAIRHLKLCISGVPPDISESEAKERLCTAIDNYLRLRIFLADEAISESCSSMIKNGDVILVYAYSSIVQRALVQATKAGIDFRVIVVDSRPKMEGRHCLRQLVKNGIKCSYVLINAVSYIMKEVSKVIVGAHSLLANGYVMSRVGTSLIALVAKSYNVPVLVCCETYKFCEKVQTDAFVINELGDPNDLVPTGRRQGNFLSDWRSIRSLGLLNLVYDVTSPDLIAMVITEVGHIPCTSVPVILRLSRELQTT